MSELRIGEFAKLANVTERTLRYYNQIGLLIPSTILKNGYRQYNENDFVKLQKILFFKKLGFTIEEIFPLVSEENNDNFKETFQMQISLLEKQMQYYHSLKETLKFSLKLLESNSLGQDRIMELISLTGNEQLVVEQYKSELNLNARINIHDVYSTNKTNWFVWILEKIQVYRFMTILEIGCGNGSMWEHAYGDVRHREIFLSDKSDGMVEIVRKKYGNKFNCLNASCEEIPFKNEKFDCIIANHVLFYLRDIHIGLQEVYRVLKSDGHFYCTTYGKNHMHEITQLVKSYDSRIELSEAKLYDIFGVENGEKLLRAHFSTVEYFPYEDSLQIDQAKPLIDYILSSYGNQREIINKDIVKFTRFIEEKINGNYFSVTKNAGLFICRK